MWRQGRSWEWLECGEQKRRVLSPKGLQQVWRADSGGGCQKRQAGWQRANITATSVLNQESLLYEHTGWPHTSCTNMLITHPSWRHF